MAGASNPKAMIMAAANVLGHRVDSSESDAH
jgi:hypothetical protein